MRNLIVFTGGGTAGHVMGNLSLICALKKEGITLAYLGSKSGIEKGLVQEYGIKYYGVHTGKWRRYFSWNNFLDLFKVILGFISSLVHLYRLKPAVIFSKGGFVSVPVVLAGWCLRVPIVIHEADFTLGLANRLAAPLADKICVSYTEALSANSIYASKKLYTGIPLREEIFQGSVEKAQNFFHLRQQKPVLLITGGSLGAQSLNRAVTAILPKLVRNYQVIHLHGEQFIPNFSDRDYHPYPFLRHEIFDALTIAEVVISRAGANTLAEILALKKLNLLIPLVEGSRGDQILNARNAENQGYSMVLEGELSGENLFSALEKLVREKAKFQKALSKYQLSKALPIILSLLKSYLS